MSSPPTRAGWLREPLLHFLLIGAALFAVYHFLNQGETGAPREIVVTEPRVEALAENFAKTWMRPPSADELKGLIDDYVAEEVYYREAIAMGLDRDDTVIRRRLRQKMEFISEDVTSAVQPTDEELQAYLEQHAEKFVQPPRLTFQQVFFSAERRGETARRDAEKLLSELNAGRGPANPAEAGDPTLLPPAMESASPQDITNSFGSEFASAVESAPVGQWAGPVQSGYGVHLVRVDERDAGTMPTLAEIRPVVQREWESEQRRNVNDALLATLRAKYEVRVEGPAAGLFEPGPRPQPAQGNGGAP
jgi:hypothetical protein